MNHDRGEESDPLSFERAREPVATVVDDLTARARERRNSGSRTASSGSRVDEPDPLQVALPRLADDVEAVLQRMTPSVFELGKQLAGNRVLPGGGTPGSPPFGRWD